MFAQHFVMSNCVDVYIIKNQLILSFGFQMEFYKIPSKKKVLKVLLFKFFGIIWSFS